MVSCLPGLKSDACKAEVVPLAMVEYTNSHTSGPTLQVSFRLRLMSVQHWETLAWPAGLRRHTITLTSHLQTSVTQQRAEFNWGTPSYVGSCPSSQLWVLEQQLQASVGTAMTAMVGQVMLCMPHLERCVIIHA